MAIRIRTVDNQRVALCAAKTISVEGDVYLDDDDHYALMLKFARGWKNLGIGISDPEDEALARSQRDPDVYAQWLKVYRQ